MIKGAKHEPVSETGKRKQKTNKDEMAKNQFKWDWKTESHDECGKRKKQKRAYNRKKPSRNIKSEALTEELDKYSVRVQQATSSPISLSSEVIRIHPLPLQSTPYVRPYHQMASSPQLQSYQARPRQQTQSHPVYLYAPVPFVTVPEPDRLDEPKQVQQKVHSTTSHEELTDFFNLFNDEATHQLSEPTYEELRIKITALEKERDFWKQKYSESILSQGTVTIHQKSTTSELTTEVSALNFSPSKLWLSPKSPPVKSPTRSPGCSKSPQSEKREQDRPKCAVRLAF